jgi:hypothetical protein
VWEDASGKLEPLGTVPYHVWAHLPVGIALVNCFGFFRTIETCREPNATVPLGDLVGPAGNGTYAKAGSSVKAPVTVPLFGSPERFPSDGYAFYQIPDITLPSGVLLATPAANGSENHGSDVPTTVNLYVAPGLGNHMWTAYESHFTGIWVIYVFIGRPLAYQVTVYIVALLPLLLGLVVVHASARQAAIKGTSGRAFDLGLIAALIAAMLAILPLRAVLVPTDLSVSSLTILDYILVLDLLFIAAFIFFQYARFVTKPKDP